MDGAARTAASHSARENGSAAIASQNPVASNRPGCDVIDAEGKTVLPGLVDSHTHLIFAGGREGEFEQRLEGKTYQEISRSVGMPENSVGPMLSRARAKLRRRAGVDPATT